MIFLITILSLDITVIAKIDQVPRMGGTTMPTTQTTTNKVRRPWGKRHGLVLGFSIIALGLGIFYTANWQALQQLPYRAHEIDVRHHAPWTPLYQVSPDFIRALIATEDRSFYRNWGISFQGIARAAWVDLHTGQFTQGGSTITQQLIRDLLLSTAKTISRKLSGILLSVMATVLYTKTQLLTMYVNEVYLGDNAYGIGQASIQYFGVPPRQLTLPEASLLAGLPQAPSLYDPLVHYHLAKDRQREVLESMVQDHQISQHRANQIFNTPLQFTKSVQRSPNPKTATKPK